MPNAIPQLPLAYPMVDASGRVTPQWAAVFREIIVRVGGSSALSNTELKALIDALQAQVDAL